MGDRITVDTIKEMQKRPPPLRPGRKVDNRCVWDRGKGAVVGFGARITSTGAVAFVLRYVVAGRERRITIGKYPDLSPAAARDMAAELRGKIVRGADPLAEREHGHRAPTVAELADRYIREHVERHNKPRTQEQVRRLVDTRIKPEFGAMKALAVRRRDVVQWHGRMAEIPTEANRALAALRKMFSLAVREWELRADNPAAGIKLFPEKPRERFLSHAELVSLGQALTRAESNAAMPEGVVTCIRLLALTGCRLSEILELRWDHVDLQGAALHLPDAKAGARSVPLGSAAVAYLRSLSRRGAFVVPGPTKDAPLSLHTVEHRWRVIRDDAGLTNARLHDLRHTVGTFAGQAGLNAFMVRDLLGHRTLAMTGRYVERATDPHRAAADAVSGRIAGALEGKPEAEIVRVVSGRGESAG